MLKEHLGFVAVSLAGMALCGLVVVGWLLSFTNSSNLTVDPKLLTDYGRGQYYFSHEPYGEYNLAKSRYYYTQVILENASTTTPAEMQMTWYQLGRIDFLEGKFDAAIYKFNRMISLFDDPMPSAHYMLGLTYGYKAKTYGNEEDWLSAEDEFKTFLEQKPESPWARTDLTWIYFAQGKYEDMVPVLEKGLEFEPNSPWLLNMYGLALLNTDQKAQAKEVFSKAKEAAAPLGEEDWGRAYPGNDARTWAENLATFKAVIDSNLELSRQE